MKDCIIVGGGLIGMLSARELKKAGLDVLVLDKGEMGRESSWAGGGILSPLHPWRYSDEVNQLANIGHLQYSQIAEELFAESGVDPEYYQCGMLVVGSEEQQNAMAWAEKWSMTLHNIEHKTGLEEVLPGLGESYTKGLWLPDIAQMRNPRLVKSVKGSLDALGIEYKEHARVDRLDVKNAQVQGVEVDGELIKAGKVLIASGAWSAGLLQGCSEVPDIEPVKGQMILFRGEPDRLNRIILAENRYLIPRKDGRILCGSSIEHSGFDKSTNEQVKQQLLDSAYEIFPALSELEVEHHWAGLRPGSPEGMPYIGEYEEMKGLYINAGHYRNGVILGAGSAQRIAEIMTA